MPFPIRGIDSDNDGAFINETLLEWTLQQGIVFTRSRVYRSNGQAFIEQKNGAVVRRFVGHHRYSGPLPGQMLVQLYQSLRLYVNYFQTSFKLLEKTGWAQPRTNDAALRLRPVTACCGTRRYAMKLKSN